MSMTSESEEWMISKNSVDSPSDVSSGGNMGANGPLKKGPWTSAEDAILVEYVTKHGEGNWNAVQKHSGLARCGKSCRLRWANHLRPDLKKGAFSPEEERHIIELHAKMGNKWARMAAELPGRTDNEIKNYWNTRIKRRQRAGLPIYPPDICLQALNDNQQNEDMTAFSSGDIHHPDFLPINNFEIPAVEFKTLELNQQLYPQAFLDIPANSLLDIPASSLLVQGLNSSYPNKVLFSTVYPSKRFRGSESLFPGLSAVVGSTLPDSNQYQSDGSVEIFQPSVFSSAYDHNSTPDHASSSSVLPGSHAVLNGNTSSSEPTTWAMKLELPSLQTHMGSWGSPSSPLPSLESVDTLIQTPPIERPHSSNLSPQNSGLLDAVLYESNSMKNSKNNSFQQTSHASIMHVDMINTSSQDLHEADWEVFAEPISPLGRSSSSVFSECTPISGNSFDELRSVEFMPVKDEAANRLVFMKYDERAETTNQMIFSRPDFVLASNCFVSKNTRTNDHCLLKDAIGTFICDDLIKDCKQMDTAAASSAQGHGPDTCAWNAMPTV